MRVTSGSRYARVFPEPVWEASNTSPPSKIAGIAELLHNTGLSELEKRAMLTKRAKAESHLYFRG